MVKINTHRDERTFKYVQWDTAYFRVKFTESALDKLGKKIQKLVDGRHEWASEMYKAIATKMRFVPNKDVNVETAKLEYEEALIGFCNEFKKHVKLNEVPKQQTIQEGIANQVKSDKQAAKKKGPMLSLKEAEKVAEKVASGK